jgi:RNA polymerase sigma factor (sigma-70 family)
MDTLKIYTEDLKIARALIDRDDDVTRNYLYRKCYPLFKSIYDNFYTDCTECKEFIDEIYMVVIAPSRITGRCQMENYRGESTLTSWLKSVCLYYCYNKFEAKSRMPVYEPLPSSSQKEEAGDRLDSVLDSVEIDLDSLDRRDVSVILEQMPNKRYSKLIRLRYLEQKSNEETAEALGMSMDNYYNKHRLAKAQYECILRKEDRRG